LLTALLTPTAAQPDGLETEWKTRRAAGEQALIDGRLNAAEKDFQAAGVAASRLNIRGDGSYASLQIRIAAVKLAQGKYVEAELLCQRNWPQVARVHGAESPEVARCLIVQAEASAALGLDHEAMSLAWLAYEIQIKKLPQENYEVAETVNRIAMFAS